MKKAKLLLAACAMALAGFSTLYAPVSLAQSYGDPYAAPADTTTRLNEIEEQLRVLTGRIDELTHRITQTNNDLQTMKQDTDLRFQDLGAPGSGTPGSGATQGGSQDGAYGSGPQGAPSGPRAGGPTNLQPPSSSGANGAAASAPAPSVTMPQGSAQMQYDFAIDLLKRGRFPEAREAFRQFIDQHPKDDLAGNAQYWLGETHYVQGQYKDAADAFLKGYTTYAKSTKAPDSLLKLGMTLSQLGQKDAACATFAELGKRFPKASPAVVARNKQERQKAGC